MMQMWEPYRKRWCPAFLEQRILKPRGVHAGRMRLNFLAVEYVEPYSVPMIRGGVQCPGVENVELHDDHAGIGSGTCAYLQVIPTITTTCFYWSLWGQGSPTSLWPLCPQWMKINTYLLHEWREVHWSLFQNWTEWCSSFIFPFFLNVCDLSLFAFSESSSFFLLIPPSSFCGVLHGVGRRVIPDIDYPLFLWKQRRSDPSSMHVLE